jgi:hypothetical protein
MVYSFSVYAGYGAEVELYAVLTSILLLTETKSHVLAFLSSSYGPLTWIILFSIVFLVNASELERLKKRFMKLDRFVLSITRNLYLSLSDPRGCFMY